MGWWASPEHVELVYLAGEACSRGSAVGSSWRSPDCRSCCIPAARTVSPSPGTELAFRWERLEGSLRSIWTGMTPNSLFMLLPQMHWLPVWLYCLLTVSLISNQGMQYYRVLHQERILRSFSNGGICSSLASCPCAHGNHQSQAEAPISLFSCLGAHQKWKNQGQHFAASHVVRH